MENRQNKIKYIAKELGHDTTFANIKIKLFENTEEALDLLATWGDFKDTLPWQNNKCIDIVFNKLKENEL